MLIDSATYVHGVRHEGVTNGTSDGFAWIGLLNPTRSELHDIQKQFGFNELAIEDAVTTHQRSKIDLYDEHAFIVVRTIAYGGREKPLMIGDLCIFISTDAVVTVRHGEAMPLATIRTDLQAQPQRLAVGPTTVLHEIIDRLVDQYLDVINHIAADVQEIEDSVFDDDIPAIPRDIYSVKRELIEFRRAAAPLLAPLTRLASQEVPFVASGFTYKFSDVLDHLLRVIDQLDALDRIMDVALQANLALIGVQQNADMRKISAWVGIAAVPTMIAGIYGMNFENMPELSTEWGYFLVVGFMVAVSINLYRLFRKNRWL